MVSMKKTKRPIVLTWLVMCSLVLSLLGGILLDDRAHAAGRDRSGRDFRGFRADKIDKLASNLRESVRAAMRRNQQDDVSVIIRLNGNMSGSLRALLGGNGVRV